MNESLYTKKGLTQRRSHIFREAEGHFSHDTPENHQQLIETALNPNNYLGKDKWGNDWYAETLANQTQIWVQVRKGEIINGGLNFIPRIWNF